ncbi:MAG: MBL fold metallo-hydrolase [Oscillospiraceae bacterium]|nr:MBL fold metallo-hydrolase [Oscillospiraceae bacterium]
MARIYPLFSSSSGNAVFVGTPDGGFLIDCGVSARRMKQALSRCGIPVEAVQGIFITHDHSDHVAGLRVFAKQHPVPVFAEPLTRESLYRCGRLEPEQDCTVLTGSTECAGIRITPFATPHDTVQSCGYRMEMPDGRICAICTDLGYISDTAAAALTGCDLVLLEANYDMQMLRTGPYPAPLKLRIASKNGHLSNDDCADEARVLAEQGTAHFVLGHLSQHNNLPELAERTVEQRLAGFVRGRDYTLRAASPETDGRMIVF